MRVNPHDDLVFPIGLGLALLLNQQLRGSCFFRSALLIPMLLTPVAVGLMWLFMFETVLGVVNYLLDNRSLTKVRVGLRRETVGG